MKTRWNPSCACCGPPTVPSIVLPNVTHEPIFKVTTHLQPEAVGNTSSLFPIARFFTGTGFFAYAPKALPPSVSALSAQFETGGEKADPSNPSPTFVDVDIDIVVVPRDYVVIGPPPFFGAGNTYAWDVPQKTIVSWHVTGPWLPEFIVQTPDISAAYNAAMAQPPGPVPIDTSQAGRVWVHFRSTSPAVYANNHYLRTLSTTPPFPDFNAIPIRFIYS